MADLNQKNDRLRGFAVLINSILTPLNENKKFQEEFRGVETKILLNATNLKYAAIVIIDHGIIRIESIPNKPETNLKKRNLGWKAYLEMDTQTFLTFAMNRLSLIGVAKKWLTHKIKMRGIRKLLILLKVFRFLANSNN